MLNFLPIRRSHPDVIDLEASAEIETSLTRVFDLLDFNSPQNALRERGYLFEEETGQNALYDFHARDPEFEDIKFHFAVETYAPQRELAFSTMIESKLKGLGNHVRSHSRYELSALGENKCQLKLTETVQLRRGLSKRNFQREFAALMFSVERHLTRLTVHAVKGHEAAALV